MSIQLERLATKRYSIFISNTIVYQSRGGVGIRRGIQIEIDAHNNTCIHALALAVSHYLEIVCTYGLT